MLHCCENWERSQLIPVVVWDTAVWTWSCDKEKDISTESHQKLSKKCRPQFSLESLSRGRLLFRALSILDPTLLVFGGLSQNDFSEQFMLNGRIDNPWCAVLAAVASDDLQHVLPPS